MSFKRRRAVFFTAALALAVYAPAPAHAFDCTKPTSPIEKVICSSTELSAKDKELATVYARAIAEAKARAPEEAIALRDGQRKWLADRDRICLGNEGQGFTSACLLKMYIPRIRRLSAPRDQTNTAHLSAPRDQASIAHQPPKAAAATPNGAPPVAAEGRNAGVPIHKEVAKEPVKPAAEPALSITRGGSLRQAPGG